MRKGIESWKKILTSVLLNELFHTEYITRSYSFSLLFFLFLAFICCLEEPCLEAGISTLVLQLYKGYLTSVPIQGSIYIVPPFFYRLCQRISAASF